MSSLKITYIKHSFTASLKCGVLFTFTFILSTLHLDTLDWWLLMQSVLFKVFEKDVIKTSFIIQQDTLPHSVYRASDYVAKSLKSSALRSVLFDELPSLRGLPQQMSEVVRVVLGVALCGGHPGNGAPVNDTGGNTFNTTNKRKTKKEKNSGRKEMKRFTLGRNISYCLSSSGIIYHERGQSEATARRRLGNRWNLYVDLSTSGRWPTGMRIAGVDRKSVV